MKKDKEMTWQEIISDLKDRGEYDINLREDGIITSRHGKMTFNLWMVQGKELICIDCKMSFKPFH